MPDTNIQGVTHFRPGSADFRACEGKIFLVVDVDGCLVTATVGTATGSEGVLYAEQLAADLQIFSPEAGRGLVRGRAYLPAGVLILRGVRERGVVKMCEACGWRT